MKIGYNNVFSSVGENKAYRSTQPQLSTRNLNELASSQSQPNSSSEDSKYIDSLTQLYIDMSKGTWDGVRRIQIDGLQYGYVENMTDEEYLTAVSIKLTNEMIAEAKKYSDKFAENISKYPSADQIENWKVSFSDHLNAYNEIFKSLNDEENLKYIRRVAAPDQAEVIIAERRKIIEEQLSNMNCQIQKTVIDFSARFNFGLPIASSIDGKWSMN